MKAKGISKIAIVVMKIAEVFHWVAVALMLAATICSAVAPKWMGCFVGVNETEEGIAKLSVYGFEVCSEVVDGNVHTATFVFFGIGAVIILALMAMVFRNLHLIFKKSDSMTPFQKDNVRMMREIGIFSIAVPVIGLIMSIIIRLVIGVDAAEISVNQSGIIMGIVVLCLTEYFVYGAKLEDDVDGLL